jgi:hypothetical protein
VPKYDTCPSCGGPKRSVSKFCNKCRYIETRYSAAEPTAIPSPDWLREFAGLFWGEGSAFIAPNNGSYSAYISLGLRADNLPVLEEIQRYLGGTIIKSNYAMKVNPHASPAYQWRITGLKRVAHVAQLLLEHSSFPAKKRQEVEQVLAFCQWRLPRISKLMSSEERETMRQMCEENKRTRVFSL